jgi:phosphohistidine swiveling domain-containing protein
LAGRDVARFDRTLPASVVAHGLLYTNVNYLVRNAGLVMPFDPASVGVPDGMLPAPAPIPLVRQLLVPWRFYRVYRWAANFYEDELVPLEGRLREAYWQLRDASADPLTTIWPLFDRELYELRVDAGYAHVVNIFTVMILDSILRKSAPELLGLFAGQETMTSSIGQHVWKLRQIAEECGATVCLHLREGQSNLDIYDAIPEAAPLVAGVRDFLRQYGHRGFEHELNFEAERLADHPGHVLTSIASQLHESTSPDERAKVSRQRALRALEAMPFAKRALWRRLLRWGQYLIAWRETSKSNLSMQQALYGLAARHLSRHFYPDDDEHTMLLYTFDEFRAFGESRGQQNVPRETLDQRRAEFETYQTQEPPPELIWYDPETSRWRPAVEDEPERRPTMVDSSQLHGIPASAGKGIVEGIALIVHDPIEAGQRLTETEGPVVLVTRFTDPAWSSLFARLTAMVTELGGVISHTAIVARENGLPAVVGVAQATQRVHDGQRVRVDGAAGVVEILS